MNGTTKHPKLLKLSNAMLQTSTDQKKLILAQHHKRYIGTQLMDVNYVLVAH